MTTETTFLQHAFCMGIYIPFVYDLFRVLRRVIPHSNWMVSLEDMSFWVYCAAKVFLMMYHESNGTLRWFAVCGALVGMFLYLKFISPIWVKFATFILGKVWEILLKILVFVLKPITKTLRRIKKKLTFQRKILKMNLKGR